MSHDCHFRAPFRPGPLARETSPPGTHTDSDTATCQDLDASMVLSSDSARNCLFSSIYSILDARCCTARIPGTEVREGQNRRADRVSQPCAHDAAAGSTREYPTPTRVLVGLLVVQVVYTTLKNTSIVLGGGGREPYYETAQSRKR
jgi:hypothetical protein